MYHGRRFENARFGALLVLLACCFLMGGASRVDVMSLFLLQPIAVVCAVAFLCIPGPFDWQPVRIPLLLLGALAAIMAAQLLPLPPALWTSLPGHGAFAKTATVAGLPQPWRPISLSPDMTLASLVGLVVPVSVLIGFASLDSHHRRLLLTVIIAGSVASALLGLAQVSGGSQSPFYLFDVTNLEAAVGLFSNRNHQAVLLAMTWPMLAVWATQPHKDVRRQAARRWVAAGLALFLLPLLLVTGSRAGLVLGAIGLASAALLWRMQARARASEPSRYDRFIFLGIGVGGVVVLLATIMASRAVAIQRLLNLETLEDQRVEATPILIRMAGDFFPVGSGFGGFDPLFRYYEPAGMLAEKYLNHAHNDLIELAITSGLPGLLIAALFLAWVGVCAFRAWRRKDTVHDMALARAASVMILLVLLSSLVDYPLRTPLMMSIVAIACGWLGLCYGPPHRPTVEK